MKKEIRDTPLLLWACVCLTLFTEALPQRGLLSLLLFLAVPLAGSQFPDQELNRTLSGESAAS